MMKKIKKIILAVIVSLITLISVFSCFKGNNTIEPILTPVSVLKPAKSNNESIISYDKNYSSMYGNTSVSFNYVKSIADNISFLPFDEYFSAYVIYYSTTSGESLFFLKVNGEEGYIINYYPDFANEINTYTTLLGGYEDNFHNLSTQQNILNDIDLSNGTQVLTYMGINVPVGQQNELLTDLISPTPFLFEGTSSSIAWTSSGLDNPNNIQNIYFNTNLTNQAIKNVLDTYIGDTSGRDIFYYTTGGVLVRCHVINNSANAFIQLIGGSTTLYKWIYDPIDTDQELWWYGIEPNIIDNGNVITSPQGNSLSGFNIYELRCLFSSANDFTETPSGDSYEQGYRDGYTAGETAGYNQGYTAGETAGQTAGYNSGYTAGETAGYNQGYLDGLDDGAGSNINFQYVESVLNLIGNFLNSIEILPNIKLSYALGVIIVLSIISIIKMVVK